MDKQQRTQKVIESFRKLPCEFGMLKGLLCVSFGLPDEDREAFDALLDSRMIAIRMDEVQAEDMAAIHSKID